MISELIQELKNKDISISFANGKLKYYGPENYLDKAMLEKLKTNKKKLLKHFWPKECWNMMPLNTDGQLPLLSLIHAGPANYPVCDYLGNNRPYYGYFYIGSEGERIRYKNLEAFATEYLKQLQFVEPEGPYYLGGLSFGGHLAFEMSLQLQRRGIQVPVVFLIDSGLPDPILKEQSLPRKAYEAGKIVYYYFYDLFWKFIFSFANWFKNKIPVDLRNKYIRWTYKEYIKKYKPAEKYKGKVIIFRASENKSTQRLLGWEKYCDNIEIIDFEGDHGAMYNNPEAVDLIRRKIKHVLDAYDSTYIIKN